MDDSIDIIDISQYDKAEVLAALYNNARVQGLGLFHYTPEPMTKEEAQELLKNKTYFDYLKGRVMKIDLKTNILRTAAYDRDNGMLAAHNVISFLKKKG